MRLVNPKATWFVCHWSEPAWLTELLDLPSVTTTRRAKRPLRFAVTYLPQAGDCLSAVATLSEEREEAFAWQVSELTLCKLGKE